MFGSHRGDRAMSDNDPSVADPFGRIADEFVEAFRQGQRPSVEEFARRYPEHADQIREILPALALMEKAKASDAPCQPAPADAAPLQQLGITRSCAKSAAGAWGWCTRRSSCPSAGTWPSRCCPGPRFSTRGTW